ncbi:hypothetical protein ABT369_17930 [Dactylosporangium sp. NPDC000244]|uniref:hypothetical protein n=1 Tax=Dactylosporangium sp. NPDC000244 TaxID=3154365 RepID=UPI003318418C
MPGQRPGHGRVRAREQGDARARDHLALNWLILERLTLPGVFTEAEADALVDAAVDRLVATGAAER